MNKVDQKIQAAARKGFYAWDTNSDLCWGVYCEGAGFPDFGYSKREAANLVAHYSRQPKLKIKVSR